MNVKFLLLVAAMLVSILWISCKKDGVQSSSVMTTAKNGGTALTTTFTGSTTLFDNTKFCGQGTSKPLCAGQNITMGSVTFNNDKDGNVYVTYTATGNWYFTELQLFVGADCAAIPVNNAGQPVPGQFPYKAGFTSPYSVQSYTFKITGLTGDCFCIAAHASVVEIVNGEIAQSQTAWGDGCDGTRISSKGNWGTRFSACKEICQDAPVACSLSQGYWFATGNNNNSGHAWPAPATVTIGGYTYTEAEGKDIWNASSSQSDGKRGFTQLAALKLSIANGTLSGIPASLQDAVTTIENFLSSKPKLTPDNCGDDVYNNTLVNAAAGAIGDWINANHCQ
jgi:hypothetical protein